VQRSMTLRCCVEMEKGVCVETTPKAARHYA